MKNLVVLLLAVICLSACGKSKPIEGKWEITHPEKTAELSPGLTISCTIRQQYIFDGDSIELKSFCKNQDGKETKASVKSGLEISDKTFEIKETKKEIVAEGILEGKCPCGAILKKGNYSYKVNGDTLELDFKSGEKGKFKRVK